MRVMETRRQYSGLSTGQYGPTWYIPPESGMMDGGGKAGSANDGDSTKYWISYTATANASCITGRGVGGGGNTPSFSRRVWFLDTGRSLFFYIYTILLEAGSESIEMAWRSPTKRTGLHARQCTAPCHHCGTSSEGIDPHIRDRHAISLAALATPPILPSQSLRRAQLGDYADTEQASQLS